jgi:hypothetical protein
MAMAMAIAMTIAMTIAMAMAMANINDKCFNGNEISNLKLKSSGGVLYL